MAESAKEDEDYIYIIKCIREKIPIINIKNESELKKIQGQYNNISLYKTEAGEIIVRDGQDIFGPKNYRQTLIE